MGIDWEGILGVEGAGMAQAYEDYVSDCIEQEEKYRIRREDGGGCGWCAGAVRYYAPADGNDEEDEEMDRMWDVEEEDREEECEDDD